MFQRGGSIVPQRWRVRRSSALMRKDPYTLVIALDASMHAQGLLYLDDETTFAHAPPFHRFSTVQFTFTHNNHGHHVLTSRMLDQGYLSEMSSPSASVLIERIVILGRLRETSKATFTSGSIEKPLEVSYDATQDAVTIRKPLLNVMSSWTITIE